MKGTDEGWARREGVILQVLNKVAIAHPGGHQADLLARFVKIINAIKRGYVGMVELTPKDRFFGVNLARTLNIGSRRGIWGGPLA